MESDFVWFAAMAGILIFPLAMIYLILRSVDWNERKFLFLDSWFVYLAWLLSGFLTITAWAFASHKFRIYNITPYLPMFALSIVAIQAFGIASVLYWRSRNKAISVTSLKESASESPQRRKIWKTSFLVSVLTFLLAAGLIIALQDIEGRFTPKNENVTESGVSFGLYD